MRLGALLTAAWVLWLGYAFVRLWHTSLSAVIRPPDFNRQLQPGSTEKIYFHSPKQTRGTLD
jgi:hypothetical protein